MLATALFDLQAFGNASQWSQLEVQQQCVKSITAFNIIIAHDGGERVPMDASPESIMQAISHSWIPLYVDEAIELSHVLANTIF